MLVDLTGGLLIERLLLPFAQREVTEGSEHLLYVLHDLLPLITHDHVLVLVGTRVLAVGQLVQVVVPSLIGRFLVGATLVGGVLLQF